MIAQLALLTSLLGGVPPQEPDRFLGEDKFKHFATSFVLTSLSGGASRAAGLDQGQSITFGVTVGVGAGLFKEVADARAGAGFSVRDLLWDLAGIGAAFLVLDNSR